jgi:diguanylate cyclase (GGDEF)-like protein
VINLDNQLDSFSQLEILQSLDVGIIIVDSSMIVKVWNRFMSNHSAIAAEDAVDHHLLTVCPTLPEAYIRRKLKSVVVLQNPVIITWQQRPHLFQINNYRSITSTNKLMYQNVRFMPIINAHDVVEHIGIVIYDVTEAANAHLSLQEKNLELTRSNRLDALTNLYNRGYWEERLELEFKRFSRSNTPSVLVMLDIDHFKRVNDTYGHQGGDAVLRALSQLLQSQYRETDIIGRYGGEEFAILLLDTQTSQALELIKNLTQKLANTKITHNNETIEITLSFGLTEINSDIKRHDQWIDTADKALYKSKQNGRNQATVLDYTP